MECPVCKNEIENSASMEEFYYDCLHCGSSLLFKKGECEVLSEGQNPPSSEGVEEPPPPPPKSFSEEEAEAEPPSPLAEDMDSRFRGNDEVHEGEKDEPPLESEEEESAEEDFSPDEVTVVPELEVPEETPPTELEEKGMPAEKSETSSAQAEEERPQPSEEDIPPVETKDESAEEPPLGEEKDFPFQEEGPAPEGPSEEKKEDLSEVAEFAGSQNAEQGPFIYTLILSEINSQDIKEKVLSVLKDEYLNLPLVELADNEGEEIIKDGKVKIEKISPVGAYVIVLSLMGLPLKISWEQSLVESAK